MKKEFIDFLNALMEAAPAVVEEKMTENIQVYIESLSKEKNEKPEITDGGKLILDYMQNCNETALKARDVAEGLFVSSRVVSGSMRKLVDDGFCEKLSSDPAIYTLTEKGKNYKIN